MTTHLSSELSRQDSPFTREWGAANIADVDASPVGNRPISLRPLQEIGAGQSAVERA